MYEWEKEIIINEDFEDIINIKDSIKNIYNVELSYSDVINLAIMNSIYNLNSAIFDIKEIADIEYFDKLQELL